MPLGPVGDAFQWNSEAQARIESFNKSCQSLGLLVYKTNVWQRHKPFDSYFTGFLLPFVVLVWFPDCQGGGPNQHPAERSWRYGFTFPAVRFTPGSMYCHPYACKDSKTKYNRTPALKPRAESAFVSYGTIRATVVPRIVFQAPLMWSAMNLHYFMICRFPFLFLNWIPKVSSN